MTGLCDPQLVNDAIKRAGKVDPAFPVVIPHERWDAPALSASERHRLVKAAKSPTKDFSAELIVNRAKFTTESERLRSNHDWMLKTGEVDPPVFSIQS